MRTRAVSTTRRVLALGRLSIGHSVAWSSLGGLEEMGKRNQRKAEMLYAAIDGAKDEILRELKSYKSKTEAKQKTGGRQAKGMLKG